MLEDDEKRIWARLERLSPPAPAVFAAACAQRLLTGYQRYDAVTGSTGFQVLGEALSELWTALAGDRPAPDFTRLAERCEELVPDLLQGEEWTVEGQYAEDAAAAASYALRCAAGGGTGLAMSAAQRGYESVDAVLQYELGFDYTQPGHEQRMQEHPLSRAEFARQERDLAELEAIAQPNELPAAVRRLRGRAQAEPIH